MATSEKKTFLGLKIPGDISEDLGIDAKKHFRSKSQHILWIVNEYLLEIKSKTLSKETNKSYTKEDIQTMKDKYNRNKKSNKEVK
tara:strand:+ start:1361 stop:1615 length:255 start_codon:yes stop_codon:yes gene_type:complete